jgi:predicted PurR-regulated permease PerM
MADRRAPDPSTRRPEVHPTVATLGAYSWRLIAIGVVAWGLINIIGALRVVVFPFVVALFLTVILNVPSSWLRQHGWRPAAAAALPFLSFLGALALTVALVVPPLSREFTDLGPTVTDGADRVENWLVDDSPFDVDHQRIDELREQAADRLGDTLNSSTGVILDTAVLALEILAGAILTLVMTFFFLKDGERFQAWALQRIPEEHRPAARRAANRGWATIGGYLRGSAALGVVEGIIIGATILLVGGGLVLPVMLVTFLAAFIPFVGAVVAGAIAVAVALATAGVGAAVIVAVVAIVVQQFDNDLLAPLVFGKTLELHPLVILVSVAAGGTLAGLAGAFVAVPLTALVINVTTAWNAGEPPADEAVEDRPVGS